MKRSGACAVLLLAIAGCGIGAQAGAGGGGYCPIDPFSLRDAQTTAELPDGGSIPCHCLPCGQPLPCSGETTCACLRGIVPASEFRAHYLRLLEEAADGREITITRRGKPVARLGPVAKRKSSYGSWKGPVKVRGNIVHGDWTLRHHAVKPLAEAPFVVAALDSRAPRAGSSPLRSP